jgi:pimeloyl-ACP methyl ester carboxylesterase
MHERDGWLVRQLESQHLVLEEAGHWLHLERPEKVAEAVQWCVERAKMRS